MWSNLSGATVWRNSVQRLCLLPYWVGHTLCCSHVLLLFETAMKSGKELSALKICFWNIATCCHNTSPRVWDIILTSRHQFWAPYKLSVKLSDFTVWRHTWLKNWVNCAVLAGKNAGLRTVFFSRLSHTQRTAQFTQGIPQFPQFTCPHHDGIISRHIRC